MSKAIAAIGMFDGVHTGHRFVLRQLCSLAASTGREPVAVTFGNHPATVLNGGNAPKLITPVDKRVELIKNEGVERVEVLPFTSDLRSLTARDFARSVLADRFHADAVLLGYDNRFGSDRPSGADAYRRLLAPLGMEVFESLRLPGAEASSTLVRNALLAGDIQGANQMLGRRFSLKGTVGAGKKIGRTLGFPTANIELPDEQLIPKHGVYAAIHNNLPVMLNIGTAPTVNGEDATKVTVEAHIVVPDGEAVPDLYGQPLEVEIIDFIREEKRFADLETLRQAIADDKSKVLKAVERAY